MARQIFSIVHVEHCGKKSLVVGHLLSNYFIIQDDYHMKLFGKDRPEDLTMLQYRVVKLKRKHDKLLEGKSETATIVVPPTFFDD